VLATRSPSAALQTIESAAGSEIGARADPLEGAVETAAEAISSKKDTHCRASKKDESKQKKQKKQKGHAMRDLSTGRGLREES
jgi:hypothetical protein